MRTRTLLLTCLLSTALLPTAAADHGYRYDGPGPLQDVFCNGQRIADENTGGAAQECPLPDPAGDVAAYADVVEAFAACLGEGSPPSSPALLDVVDARSSHVHGCASDALYVLVDDQAFHCAYSVLDGSAQPRIRADHETGHVIVDPGLHDDLPIDGSSPGLHVGLCSY